MENTFIQLLAWLLIAAFIVSIWSFVAYRQVSSYYRSHYVRGHYRRSLRRFL